MSIHFEKNKYIEIAALEKTKSGNEICGDAHIVVHGEDYTVCAVIDGLGSGESANESATAAVKTIERNHHQSVEDMMAACNDAMRLRRGGVITIIKIHYKKRLVEYSNVGNIHFIMYTPEGITVRPIPAKGYLHGRRMVITSRIFTYEENSVFLIYSDGVIEPSSRRKMIDVDFSEASIHKLFTEFRYANDDATVLFGRLK